MEATRPAITAELARKKCLACGYDGRVLQGDRGRLTFECPSCGADLYARPPRSYAELEGLAEPTPAHTHRVIVCDEPEFRSARRRTLAHGGRAARLGTALEKAVLVSIGVTFVGVMVAGALVSII